MNKKVLSAITLMPVILAGKNHQGATQSQEQHMSAMSTTRNNRRTALSLQMSRGNISRTTRDMENDTIDDNRMQTMEGTVSTIEATQLTVPTVAPDTSQGEDAPAAELPATPEEELSAHTQSVSRAEDVEDDSTYKISVQCEDTATDQPEEMRAIIEQCVREQLKAIQQELTGDDTESSEGPSAISVLLDTVRNLLIDASIKEFAGRVHAKLQEHTTRQDNDTATEEPTETRTEESNTEEALSATTTKGDELTQKISALSEIDEQIAAIEAELTQKTSALRAIKAHIADIEADIEDQNKKLDKKQKTLAEKESELQAKQEELLTIKKKLNKSVSVITACSDNMKTLQDRVNDTVSQITSAIYTHSPEQYIIAHIKESISHSKLVDWYQRTDADKEAIVRRAYKHAEENYKEQLSKLLGDKIDAKMFALKYAKTLKEAAGIVIEKSEINALLKDLNISMNDNKQTYDAGEKYMEQIITSLAACHTEISALQDCVEKLAQQYKEDQQAAAPYQKEKMLDEIAQDNTDLLVKMLNKHTGVLAQYLEAQLKSDNSEREDAQKLQDAQKLLGLICGQMINLAQVGIESEKKPHDE